MKGQYYRDLVLNGSLSEDEMSRIIGMANAIVRFLSEYIDSGYCNLSDSKKAEAIVIRDDFTTIHFSDWEGIKSITHRLFTVMECAYWFIDPNDVYLFPHARWEAYWLMRGTTALDFANDIGDEFRIP